MIGIKRRQGNLMFVVHLPSWTGFARAVHAVDQALITVLGKFSRWSVIAALGIGLGIGATVSLQPQPVSALPELVIAQPEGTPPLELHQPGSIQHWPIVSGGWPKFAAQLPPVQWLEAEGGLRETGHVVLLTNAEVIKTWIKFDRGQTLMVLGSNQGRYHYHLTDTHWLKREQLDKLIAETHSGLIITGPADWWGQEWIAILAVPAL